MLTVATFHVTVKWFVPDFVLDDLTITMEAISFSPSLEPILLKWRRDEGTYKRFVELLDHCTIKSNSSVDVISSNKFFLFRFPVAWKMNHEECLWGLFRYHVEDFFRCRCKTRRSAILVPVIETRTDVIQDNLFITRPSSFIISSAKSTKVHPIISTSSKWKGLIIYFKDKIHSTNTHMYF